MFNNLNFFYDNNNPFYAEQAQSSYAGQPAENSSFNTHSLGQALGEISHHYSPPA